MNRCIWDTELQAIDDELVVNCNSDLVTSFRQFLIANALLTNNPLYDPYTYSKAETYKNATNGGLNMEGEIIYNGSLVHYFSETIGNGRLMRLGADYINITAHQGFSIKMTPINPEADIDIILLKLNSVDNAFSIVYSARIANDYIIHMEDPISYDKLILIIVRFDWKSPIQINEQYALEVAILIYPMYLMTRVE